MNESTKTNIPQTYTYIHRNIQQTKHSPPERKHGINYTIRVILLVNGKSLNRQSTPPQHGFNSIS